MGTMESFRTATRAEQFCGDYRGIFLRPDGFNVLHIDSPTLTKRICHKLQQQYAMKAETVIQP